MAGGTYSNNITIKVSSAIDASTSGTGTLYTCSSSGYALVNLYSSAGVTVTIGGRIVFENGTPGSSLLPGQGFVVGPSQTVAVTANGSGATVTVSGVEFINSP